MRIISPRQQSDTRIYIQGQSNAAGRALRTDLSLMADTALYSTYNAAPFDRVWIFTGTNYEKLEMGVNQGSGDATQFGPEFGLAVRWMREVPTFNLYIDKHATGGVGISYFQKSGGGIYSTVQSDRAAADIWLAAHSKTPTDKGMLFVQGESDTAATQTQFYDALVDIFSTRISDGLQSATSKRILEQMLPATPLYASAVAAAKAQYAAAYSATARAIDMPNYFDVSVAYHLNAQGQVQMGYDAFQYLLEATGLRAA